MKQPEDILKGWMAAINAGDVESLLALYDEKAVLIPTFSNRILSCPEKIRQYFELLGSREELSIALHEKTLIVQPMDNRRYAMCGIYCWRFAIDGELLSFEARFSYVLDLKLSSPIIHHHSSQIPRML
ncbi:MAG: DUF4440 domain-containing protein [Nitrospirae bacterium]|nr:DUF4440 domain-containing protein [Nitrospirota bacterium]